jgi:hypothetical protein
LTFLVEQYRSNVNDLGEDQQGAHSEHEQSSPVILPLDATAHDSVEDEPVVDRPHSLSPTNIIEQEDPEALPLYPPASTNTVDDGEDPVPLPLDAACTSDLSEDEPVVQIPHSPSSIPVAGQDEA